MMVSVNAPEGCHHERIAGRLGRGGGCCLLAAPRPSSTCCCWQGCTTTLRAAGVGARGSSGKPLQAVEDCRA